MSITLHENAPVAIAELSDVFGDGMTASHTGASFTCTEADVIARVLYLTGQEDAAITWLLGHAEGEDWDDTHAHPYDQEKGDAERRSPRAFNEADIRGHLAAIA
ncbi:hypothetical protein AB0D13_02875 [Streptomyces sp. NPDC048430]|uniref:hypothetical protein n=1 Tax=Streptomyces sp. NPDC048430 TaxID=3155388 RepID=UPI00341D4505